MHLLQAFCCHKKKKGNYAYTRSAQATRRFDGTVTKKEHIFYGNNTIGFIGLGLIGGSIDKAIRKFHPEYQILAYNRTRDTLEDAVFDGIVDIACDEQDSKFALCDIIFLCATVDYNIECLPWLKQIIRPGCILTDVGSVKGEIHKEITALSMAPNFIGGHPMAGSEKTGYEHSTDHLIENAY